MLQLMRLTMIIIETNAQLLINTFASKIDTSMVIITGGIGGQGGPGTILPLELFFLFFVFKKIELIFIYYHP